MFTNQRTIFHIFFVVCVWAFGAINLAAANEEKVQVIPPETSKMTALRETVEAEIDSLSDRLIEINDWMYHNPEPGFLEFKALSKLVDEMKRHGFTVEMGIPDLGTDDIPEVAGHSQDSADITISPAGHKSLILTSKVISAVGLRLVLDEELRKKAKSEHAEWLRKYKQ
jgi:hypothetical protein